MSDESRLVMMVIAAWLGAVAAIAAIILLCGWYYGRTRKLDTGRRPDVIFAHFNEDGRDVIKWRRKGDPRWRELRLYGKE